MGQSVTIAVEGATDAAVAKRLLAEAGYQCGAEYIRRGKASLDERLHGYNNAARFSCWLVLRDLDRDAGCAPELLGRLLPEPAPNMRLHVPVRAIEAWLLADVDGFSSFFAVPRARIPSEPEALPNPKQAVLDVARHSRKKAISESLVPQEGTTARVGPGYTSLMIQFATDRWRPDVADPRCESLARLRRFLRGASR